MKRLFDPCRKYQVDICAVGSGELPAADRACLERHLESCADCRRYRDEIGDVTALLSTSGKLFGEVEPREATQIRWQKDIEAAIKPADPITTRVFRGLLDLCRDMIWPARRIWVGMAAVWVLVLTLNVSSRSNEQTQVRRQPAPEFIRALLAREGFLPGAGRPAEGREPESSRSASPHTRN
jgi:anti-sigma factor RsiW